MPKSQQSWVRSLRHSGIWQAADDVMLNKVNFKNPKKFPQYIGCLKNNDTLTIYLAEAISFFQFVLRTFLFSTMNQVVLCTYSEMHSHVHWIVALWHWAKAYCPFSSEPDVQESHHRKTRGKGSGCGHVTGRVNPSLGSEGYEDYF